MESNCVYSHRDAVVIADASRNCKAEDFTSLVYKLSKHKLKSLGLLVAWILTESSKKVGVWILLENSLLRWTGCSYGQSTKMEATALP